MLHHNLELFSCVLCCICTTVLSTSRWSVDAISAVISDSNAHHMHKSQQFFCTRRFCEWPLLRKRSSFLRPLISHFPSWPYSHDRQCSSLNCRYSFCRSIWQISPNTGHCSQNTVIWMLWTVLNRCYYNRCAITNHANKFLEALCTKLSDVFIIVNTTSQCFRISGKEKLYLLLLRAFRWTIERKFTLNETRAFLTRAEQHQQPQTKTRGACQARIRPSSFVSSKYVG